jgi:hypothetical protein
LSNPCVTGTCNFGPNYWICACPLGYSGVRCESAINNCDLYSQPCLNNGTCLNQPLTNSYKCLCPTPFTGSRCETNYCANKPCINGICNSNSNGYTCTCNPGYTGQNCGQAIDLCASNPCGVSLILCLSIRV